MGVVVGVWWWSLSLHSFVHHYYSSMHAFIHQYHPFNHSFIRSCMHSSVPSIQSFIHACIHSSVLSMELPELLLPTELQWLHSFWRRRRLRHIHGMFTMMMMRIIMVHAMMIMIMIFTYHHHRIVIWTRAPVVHVLLSSPHPYPICDLPMTRRSYVYPVSYTA